MSKSIRVLAAATVLLVASCGTQTTNTTGTSTTTTTASVTPQQVVNDAAGLVSALQAIETIVAQDASNSLTQGQQTQITNDLQLAQTGLAKLQAGLPTAQEGAVTVQAINGYINDAVGVAALLAPKFPALAPAVPLIEAADAILPVVEAYVDQYLPTGTVAARKAFRKSPMSVPTARAYLRIPVA